MQAIVADAVAWFRTNTPGDVEIMLTNKRHDSLPVPGNRYVLVSRVYASYLLIQH